ncbi:MAG TPA: hypothetical protein VIW29_00350 [Polyangiaceae bacterium]
MTKVSLGALAIACLGLCYACGDDDDGGKPESSAGTGAVSTGESGAANTGGSGNVSTGGSGSGTATCKETCPDVVDAGCDLVPESVEECEQQCDDFLGAGACSEQWAELQTCAEDKDIVCTTGTPSLPAPEGCEALQQQFVACYLTSG